MSLRQEAVLYTLSPKCVTKSGATSPRCTPPTHSVSPMWLSSKKQLASVIGDWPGAQLPLRWKISAGGEGLCCSTGQHHGEHTHANSSLGTPEPPTKLNPVTQRRLEDGHGTVLACSAEVRVQKHVTTHSFNQHPSGRLLFKVRMPQAYQKRSPTAKAPAISKPIGLACSCAGLLPEPRHRSVTRSPPAASGLGPSTLQDRARSFPAILEGLTLSSRRSYKHDSFGFLRKGQSYLPSKKNHFFAFPCYSKQN